MQAIAPDGVAHPGHGRARVTLREGAKLVAFRPAFLENIKRRALGISRHLATRLARRVFASAQTLPPNDPPPQILSTWLSQSTAHRGDLVRGRVIASPNTASVEVRIGGYGEVMQKVDATTFVMEHRVPWLPFFLHRTWTVRVIARNTAGVATEQDTSISIR